MLLAGDRNDFYDRRLKELKGEGERNNNRSCVSLSVEEG